MRGTPKKIGYPGQYQLGEAELPPKGNQLLAQRLEKGKKRKKRGKEKRDPVCKGWSLTRHRHRGGAPRKHFPICFSTMPGPSGKKSAGGKIHTQRKARHVGSKNTSFNRGEETQKGKLPGFYLKKRVFPEGGGQEENGLRRKVIIKNPSKKGM